MVSRQPCKPKNWYLKWNTPSEVTNGQRTAPFCHSVCLVWSAYCLWRKKIWNGNAFRQGTCFPVRMIPPHTRSNWWAAEYEIPAQIYCFHMLCTLQWALEYLFCFWQGLHLHYWFLWVFSDSVLMITMILIIVFFITMDCLLALDWIEQTAWDWNRCLYTLLSQEWWWWWWW